MSAVPDAEFAAMLAEAKAVKLITEQLDHPAPRGLATTSRPPAPVGECRACNSPLAVRLIDAPDNTGLHAGCDEPSPPPSTLADMRDALIRHDNSRPRSRQRRLGPSELGTPCDRQIAMKLAGVRQKARGLAWAPLLGTAWHRTMEDVLAEENARLARERYLIEFPLSVEDGAAPEPDDGTGPIRGHGDAYDLDTDCVIDWKLTGTTARRKARRVRVPNEQLVSPEYRVQGHVYGYGYKRAGFKPRWVRVVMFARSHDFEESTEWTERYREDVALDALGRYYRLRDTVTNGDMAGHPERLATVPAVPGDACKWCPFLRITPKGGAPVDATGCEGASGQTADPASFLKV